MLRHWLAEKGLLRREVRWRIEERGSPFRGLLPFDAQHADVFFGRGAEIERGRERLVDAATRGAPFLLILGASGTGKSSLARAGRHAARRELGRHGARQHGDAGADRAVHRREQCAEAQGRPCRRAAGLAGERNAATEQPIGQRQAVQQRPHEDVERQCLQKIVFQQADDAAG